MNVLIFGSYDEYHQAFTKELCEQLCSELTQKGHQINTVFLPFSMDISYRAEQLTAYRIFDLSTADLVITVGEPAFAVSHRHKRCILFDLSPDLTRFWNSEYGILDENNNARLRNAILTAEKDCLCSSEYILCTSKALADNIELSFAKKSAYAYFCLPSLSVSDHEQLACPDRIVMETGLQPFSRIDLSLAALSKTDIRLKMNLFIPFASPVHHKYLNSLINQYELQDRIDVIERGITNAEIEESLLFLSTDYQIFEIPFPLLNAVNKEKTVICISDAGAPCEVIPSCWQASPDMDSLVEKITQVVNNSEKPRKSSVNLLSVTALAEKLADPL